MDNNAPKPKGKRLSSKKLKTLFGKRDNQAKIFFLFLAIFLWVLLKLSKEEGFIQVVDFPVEYTNFPARMELKNAPPQQISLRLKAPGFNLLRYTFRSFKPIKVNVAELKTVGSGNKSYWITNNQRAFIEQQMEADVEVLSIWPDTIEFDYAELQSKKVPVILKLEKKFNNFSSLYDQPRLLPDSVELIGAAGLLRGIDSIRTKKMVVTDEQDSVIRKVGLEQPTVKGVTMSHKQVSVELRVARLTEKVLERQIEVRNLPDSLELVIFPKAVKMQLQLALKDFDKISPVEVIPFVDYNDLSVLQEEPSLRIQYEPLPEFVRHVTIEPRRIEFILTQK
jgi:hypothetical protein